MNELRKEYHNKTAGQIGEKARDLKTSYFTDEYVFWLEDQLKQLRIASVVNCLSCGKNHAELCGGCVSDIAQGTAEQAISSR